MALLPNLGRSVLEGMNVEAVTSELQEMTKNAKASSSAASQNAPAPVAPSPEPSLPPSSDSDVRSDNDSISVVSHSGQEEGTSVSDLGASTTSWVENMSSDQGSLHSHSPQTSSSSNQEPSHSSPPEFHVPTDLSESFISSSSVSYGDITVSLCSNTCRSILSAIGWPAGRSVDPDDPRVYKEQSGTMEGGQNAEWVI